MFVLGCILAAIVGAAPGTEATVASDRSNIGLCSPAAPVPSRGGPVEGRVTWEDGSPRENVAIRARTQSRTQVTTSDATGKYELDVDDEVFLEFRDAHELVGAACRVRPVPSRVTVVDVILGLRRDDEASLGCQVPADFTAEKQTWSGTFVFLDSKEAEEVFGPPPATQELRLNLEITDVASVLMTAKGAQLELTPSAMERWRSFYNEHVGETVVTTIGGVPATRFAIWVPVAASTPMWIEIQSSSLTPEHRARLCELLKNVRSR